MKQIRIEYRGGDILTVKRIYAISAVLLVVLMMALGSGIAVYYRLLFFMLLLTIFAHLWARINLSNISITFARNYEKLQVGAFVETTVILKNKSFWPKFNLEISDLSEIPGPTIVSVFNILPHGETTLKLVIPLLKRGIYNVKSPSIYSVDPFGIFNLRKVHPGIDSVTILPYTVDIAHLALSDSLTEGEGESFNYRGNANTSVSTIREYQHGDNTRYIHWPATAKRGQLMLRQFDTDADKVIWILLDLEDVPGSHDNPDSMVEYSITAAASIAKVYSETGWAVGLMCHGGDEILLEPNTGESYLAHIFLNLAKANIRGSIPLADLIDDWQFQATSRSSSLVVVTSSLENRWITSLFACQHRGVSAAVVFVDPASFGVMSNGDSIIEELNGKGISTYIIRQGDDMVESLSPIKPVDLSVSESAKSE